MFTGSAKSKGLSELWKVQIIDKIMTIGQWQSQYKKKKIQRMHNPYFIQDRLQNHFFSAFHKYFSCVTSIILVATSMTNKFSQTF